MATKDLLSLNLSANYNPVVYYVYILAGRSRMLYTGVTNSADRRIAEHKHKLIEGFTRHYDIDRLVHLEEHSSQQQILRRSAPQDDAMGKGEAECLPSPRTLQNFETTSP